MVDPLTQTPAVGPGVAGQPGTLSVHDGQAAAQQQTYVSPVFDLHASPPAAPAAAAPVTPIAPAAPPAAAAPGSRVQIGQETIQIAPHPTTNRFPWTPVPNPTVPVYGTVPQPAAEPAPPAPIPTPPPVPAPVPPPPPAPTPIPVALPPVAAAVSSPVSEPAPAPPPPPPPVEPVKPPEVHLQTGIQLPPPPPPPRPARHSGRTIYGEATQLAWSILRPAKLIKLLSILLVVAAFFVGILIWVANGASSDLLHLPFMEQLLERK